MSIGRGGRPGGSRERASSDLVPLSVSRYLANAGFLRKIGSEMVVEYATPDLRLLDLNKKIRGLGKLLRRNGRGKTLAELSDGDREELRDIEELLEILLWKVCLHETDEVAVAAASVDETRRALFALLDEAENGTPLRRVTAHFTLRMIPPNAWLFLRVKESLQATARAAATLSYAARRDEPELSELVKGYPDPIRQELAVQHCGLRDYKRRQRPNRDGDLDLSRECVPMKFCQRACDLLLTRELGFKVREAELALGVSRAVVHDRTEDCRRQGEALFAKRATSDADGKPRRNSAAQSHV